MQGSSIPHCLTIPSHMACLGGRTCFSRRLAWGGGSCSKINLISKNAYEWKGHPGRWTWFAGRILSGGWGGVVVKCVGLPASTYLRIFDIPHFVCNLCDVHSEAGSQSLWSICCGNLAAGTRSGSQQDSCEKRSVTGTSELVHAQSELGSQELLNY